MDRVLKLDSGYSPIEIINWKDAIRLIFLGKAEIIREYNKFIKTVNLNYKIPAVIRLITTFQRRKGYVRLNKRNVFIRDNWQCLYCGTTGNSSTLTVDHILPRSKGGITKWENLATCCKPCNGLKGNKLLNEIGFKLRKMPIHPDWLPNMLFRFIVDIPEEWQEFIRS